MIRKALQSDFDSILSMCENFWTHTMYDEDFDPDHTELMIWQAFDHKLLAVADIDGAVGFVAGIKGPLLANASILTGVELAWWVEPEHRRGRIGIDLIIYIEGLAKDAGIKYWSMISMQSSCPGSAETIYKRLGYKKNETTFIKVL